MVDPCKGCEVPRYAEAPKITFWGQTAVIRVCPRCFACEKYDLLIQYYSEGYDHYEVYDLCNNCIKFGTWEQCDYQGKR